MTDTAGVSNRGVSATPTLSSEIDAAQAVPDRQLRGRACQASSPPCPLDELLELAAAGRIDALGRIYDLTVPWVFQACASMVDGGELAAEIVTQQVFVRIWRAAGSYDRAHECGLTFIMDQTRRTATNAGAVPGPPFAHGSEHRSPTPE